MSVNENLIADRTVETRRFPGLVTSPGDTLTIAAEETRTVPEVALNRKFGLFRMPRYLTNGGQEETDGRKKGRERGRGEIRGKNRSDSFPTLRVRVK